MTAPIEPGWLTLLPPLVTIVLALVFREVVSSLFAGIWLGALYRQSPVPGRRRAACRGIAAPAFPA
jgi:hypothetical protein